MTPRSPNTQVQPISLLGQPNELHQIHGLAKYGPDAPALATTVTPADLLYEETSHSPKVTKNRQLILYQLEMTRYIANIQFEDYLESHCLRGTLHRHVRLLERQRYHHLEAPPERGHRSHTAHHRE